MSLRQRRRPRYTLLVMVLLSITIITFSAKGVPVLGTVRSAALEVVGPIGRGFSSLTRPVRNWWGGATDYDRLQAENRKLRAEIGRLTGKQIRTSSAAAELSRLQEQLNMPFAKDIPAQMAQVATGPFSSFDDNTIVIDQGSRSGIAKDMPVVTSLGLVGRIESTTDNRSVVRLITDKSFHVGVKLASSGNYALGHGNGPDKPFRIDEGVELTQPVTKGEAVVTSGLGRASFPKDIPIGFVTKVLPSQADQSQVLEVPIAADLVRLNVVRVLLWEPPS